MRPQAVPSANASMAMVSSVASADAGSATGLRHCGKPSRISFPVSRTDTVPAAVAAIAAHTSARQRRDAGRPSGNSGVMSDRPNTMPGAQADAPTNAATPARGNRGVRYTYWVPNVDQDCSTPSTRKIQPSGCPGVRRGTNPPTMAKETPTIALVAS